MAYYDFKCISNDCTKIFYSSTRTVFLNTGVRLSFCMLCSCRFPTLTCDKCCYGT